MLRLLVDFLSGIIRVLAVVCIVGGTVAGYLQAASLDVEPWAGALIGFAAGFLAASVTAGLIACVILIENHLRVLADAQTALRSRDLSAPPERETEEAALERAERLADTYARTYRQRRSDRPPHDRPEADRAAAAKSD